MIEPTFAPEQTIAALNAANVDYVIVGGMALAAHGVICATAVLHLVADPSAKNLRRLAGALTELGAEQSIGGGRTGSAFGRPISLKLRTRYGRVQVLNGLPSVPPYAYFRKSAIRLRVVSGTIATVCSRTDLRAMKLASVAHATWPN